MLYIYKTVRDPKAPGGARFVPELVHNKSGVGSSFDVVDLNKDGKLDIVVGDHLRDVHVHEQGRRRRPPLRRNRTATRTRFTTIEKLTIRRR